MSRDQVRAFDRSAIERLGVPGVVLMENAGRGCVDVMRRVGVDGPVLVVCGKGNNAGDGFVVARRLCVLGCECRVALSAAPSELRGDTLAMFEALTHCGVPILDTTGVSPSLMLGELDALARDADWVVDALLGTGAKGAPRPPYDTLIDWINGEGAKRLAVDLPSGLDCDSGEPARPTVVAHHTCTFLAEKAGFANTAAGAFLGEVHVLDIGVPIDAVRRADSQGVSRR